MIELSGVNSFFNQYWIWNIEFYLINSYRLKKNVIYIYILLDRLS
jgi:hypothetical protein